MAEEEGPDLRPPGRKQAGGQSIHSPWNSGHESEDAPGLGQPPQHLPQSRILRRLKLRPEQLQREGAENVHPLVVCPDSRPQASAFLERLP
jgi:hypothetical protein